MEMIFPYALYIGVPVLIGIIFVRLKKRGFTRGIKVVNTKVIRNTPLFNKLLKRYQFFVRMVLALSVLCILVSLVLLARPAKTEIIKPEQNNRDVFLCMDVSTSVNEINEKLIPDLKKMVTELAGDRFGIAIFNTTEVVLVPLTDDYEYVLETLDTLEKVFRGKLVNSSMSLAYLTDGITLGNETRGSSLIGDGLAACIYNFPNLNEERSRSIIFTTDNELEGTPYLTLSEAASLCANNSIVVYGIAPKEIDATYKTDEASDFKAAVEKTNGKLYIQSKNGTVSGIVDSIKELRASESQGLPLVKKTDLPEVPFVCLVLCYTALLTINFFQARGKKVVK